MHPIAAVERRFKPEKSVVDVEGAHVMAGGQKSWEVNIGAQGLLRYSFFSRPPNCIRDLLHRQGSGKAGHGALRIEGFMQAGIDHLLHAAVAEYLVGTRAVEDGHYRLAQS